VPDFEVNPDGIRDYAKVLDGLNSAISAINNYAQQYGCDKSGFTGLFVVLQPVVDMIGSLFGDTLKFGSQRLASLVTGVEQVADAFEQIDKNSAKALQDLLAQLEEASTSSSSGSGTPEY
jgi:uncharacterized protein YukE